jgi:guanylate kinase
MSKKMINKHFEFEMKKYGRLGVILVVSGPSGAGKSTICKKVIIDNNLHFSVSCTTRKPREGETHGKDYYFTTREEFKEKIQNNEFIEYAEVHGNYYGTLRDEVIKVVASGKSVLLDIDVQGAFRIKKTAKKDSLLSKCVEYVFIAPPDFNELEKRLRGRGTETEDVIQKRLNNAEQELSYLLEYDYLVVNETVEKAVEDMNSILEALTKKTQRIVKA